MARARGGAKWLHIRNLIDSGEGHDWRNCRLRLSRLNYWLNRFWQFRRCGLLHDCLESMHGVLDNIRCRRGLGDKNGSGSRCDRFSVASSFICNA